MAEEADRARASVVSTPSAEMNLNNLMNLLLILGLFISSLGLAIFISNRLYASACLVLTYNFSYSLSIPSLFGIRGQNVILIDVRNT
jgi:hypothetical protein